MLACVDVSYGESVAHAACVVFRSWTDAVAAAQFTATTPIAATYRPGEFFQRELPPILAVLGCVDVALRTVVVDGYVWLGGTRPGLGERLHAALGQRIPVVGVAKTSWADGGHGEGPRRSVAVVRGRSAKPLYVTSVGVDVAIAAAHVKSMHGPHRLPTLLKAVDRLARAELEAQRRPG